jgi:hypothetical protein
MSDQTGSGQSGAGAAGNQAGAGSGAGGAGDPGAAGGQPGASGGGQSGDWTSALTPEMRGFVQNKGFKDPAGLIESYQNSESLIGKLTGAGKDRILVLPDRADAPEWNAVHEKLGRPKDAKGYELPIPEGSDPKFAEAAATKLHELGVPKEAGQKLGAWWNEQVAAMQKADQAQAETRRTEAASSLKKEWGAAYQQNMDLVDSTAAKLGLSDQHVTALGQALGNAEAAKLIHKLGLKTGEHGFTSGDSKTGGGGALTPAAAQARINDLKNDRSFVDRLTKGEIGAKEEWDRLHRQMHPENG